MQQTKKELTEALEFEKDQGRLMFWCACPVQMAIWGGNSEKVPTRCTTAPLSTNWL